jgi:serine/threonine protein kinase
MAINQPMTVLPVGTLVNDRFRVKKLLGQGGYGNVYLVEDEARLFGNRFALKESLSSTTSEHRQFTREAKWLLNIDHPNLPAVIAQFEWNSRPYFAMAYVDGENLEDRVDRLGPLPEDQVLSWMRPVAEAVSYLHTQKKPIIHRDIKPGNIIVTKDGRPLLVDFGIAKEVTPALRARKTTRAARAVSGGYSPLEQYTRGGTDVRSDVYALGATLYHLLTGVCPPEAPDIASGTVKLPEPRQFNPKISRQTEQVILKAMRQKPEDRYQTVREFLDALPGGPPASASAGPAVAAPPPVKSSKSGKRAAKAAKAAPPTPALPDPPAQMPTPAASFQTPVLPPLPGLTPINQADLAQTVIGRPPAQPAYAPPAPLPAQPPLSPAPLVRAPVAVASAQPTPLVRPSTGTQEFVIPPEVAAVSKQQMKPKKSRVRLAASLGALLCGLAVLGSIVLTIVLLRNHQTDVFYIHYEALAAGEWWMTVLLVAIPAAALLLVFLPLFHWFGILGRFGTYCWLLLVPLLGVAPVIAWIASGQADPFTGLFAQGFVVPCLLFVLSWLMTVWQIFRQK